MPREDREERPRNKVRGQTTDLPIPGGGDRYVMDDYKPNIPGVGGMEEPTDYRSRKQAYQESLGAGGRKQFRQGLNERWDRIAQQLLSGVPLEQLVERFGEGGGPREGRNSVAWDQWTSGNNPGLQRAIRNRDMFQGAIARGRVQEYPPGSGRYYGQWFSNKPQWYDRLGNVIGGGEAPPPVESAPVNTPTPAPIEPGTITSGGISYVPPGSTTPPVETGGARPTPQPTGLPIRGWSGSSIRQPVGMAGINQPPSYLTGSTLPQTGAWGSQSPYSANYNSASPHARGLQQRRRPWTFPGRMT